MGEYIAGGPIVAGGTGTDTRIYAYDARGRVTQEPFFMVSSPNTSYLANGPQTSLYQFDNNTESGIGVRTLQSVNANIGDEVTSQDNFQRMTGDYSASLSSQGAQTQTPWSLSYDALGSGTSRNIVESGTTYAAQTLTSDAWGRLVKVSQRDTGSSDYDWTAVYDGFGRRLQTTWQPMTSGSNSGPSSYIQYFFDPQVEFLELGWNDNGGRMWKVYGPDANGVYGGDQGCGGLENEIWEAQSWCIAPLNNEFGDAEGYVYDTSITGSGTFQTYAYGLPMGEYGCEPGQYLYNNGVGNNVLPTPQWRGHYVDETGFVWMGTRYYEPISGKFLSPDVLGHAVSPDLYSYCGGDGVNGLDGDGRGTIEANNTLTQTSSSQPLYGPYQTVTGVGITTQGNNPESIPQASSSQGQQGSTVIVQGGISGASSETSSGASSSLANNNPSGNVGLYIWGVGEPAAPPDPFAYTETPYEQYLAHAPQSPVTTIVAMVALNVATTVMLPEIEPALAATSLAEIGVADTSEGTITVIGSLQDTAAYAGRPGYNVLNVPEEAYNAMSAQEFDRLNAEWLNQAFQRGDTIMAVTNPVAHAQYLESIAPALSFQSRYLNLELPMAQEFGVIPLNAATPY
jgi:RHS repeat-associated protein